MKQGGVEVVDVYRVVGNVEAKSVGLAMYVTCSYSAAGQPNRKATIVMISTVIRSLYHGRAPKLTTPDNQCVIEQSALLQILHERRTGLICFSQFRLTPFVRFPCCRRASKQFRA